MSEPDISFTPAAPDPRLEVLDDEIAKLIAEALYDYILSHGLRKRQSEEHLPSYQEASKASSTQEHNAVDTKP